jgi:hypothetical protein
MKVTRASIFFNYKEQCEFNIKLGIKNYPDYKRVRKISRGFPHLFKKCLPAHPQVNINTRQIIKMSRSLHKHSGKPKSITIMVRLPDGRPFTISLHKVLMDLFKPIEENLPDIWKGIKFTKEQLDELRDLYLINHIDHNPFNNNLDNLERVSLIRNFEAAREHYAKDD